LIDCVCDGEGRTIAVCLTAGQVSDHIGAKILYPVLREGNGAILIANKEFESDEYRAALEAKGIASCIPPRKGQKSPAKFYKTQYK
tara:strand:- start:873 stop:1130 length:258 start_codon:yes stop_codon:yes gene_type:complete